MFLYFHTLLLSSYFFVFFCIPIHPTFRLFFCTPPLSDYFLYTCTPPLTDYFLYTCTHPLSDYFVTTEEPQRERKHNFWHMSQTRLKDTSSQSDQSLCWRNFAFQAIKQRTTKQTPNDYSNQIAWMHRLIWIFAERKLPKVCFLTLQLIKLLYVISHIFSFICLKIRTDWR